MIHSYKQGLKGFKYLLNFKDYKHSEIALKLLFLPLALPLFAFLFVVSALFFTVERLLAPVFRVFLVFQMRMIQKRSLSNPWQKRGYSLITFIVTIVFLPFVISYYLSMLVKSLTKYMMRSLIFKLDFSVQYAPSTLMLFDDDPSIKQTPFTSMMKDAQQTEQIGTLLQQYFDAHPELEDETILKNDDVKKP